MTDLLQMAVLSSVALCCGLLGPFVVLRKMAMFANSLSHTILIGIALAFILSGGAFFDLQNLLIGALVAAFLTAFLTGGLVRYFGLSEDAGIGFVFTTLFALGITVVTLYTRDVHLGIEMVLGNVDLLQVSDLGLTLFLAALSVLAVTFFYKQFLLISFDSSQKLPFFHFLLLFLVSLSCIGAFRAVGVLLVLIYLVGPYLIARKFCHELKKLLFWTPFIGISVSILAVLASRGFYEWFGWPLSTSGLVATFIGLIYLVSIMLAPCKNRLPS